MGATVDMVGTVGMGGTLVMGGRYVWHCRYGWHRNSLVRELGLRFRRLLCSSGVVMHP